MSEKTKKENLYSDVPTSTEEKTALKKTISETLSEKPRQVRVSTGRLGYIQFHLALINEVRVQKGLDPLTDKETVDQIEKYKKEIPEGLYHITI